MVTTFYGLSASHGWSSILSPSPAKESFRWPRLFGAMNSATAAQTSSTGWTCLRQSCGWIARATVYGRGHKRWRGDRKAALFTISTSRQPGGSGGRDTEAAWAACRRPGSREASLLLWAGRRLHLVHD